MPDGYLISVGVKADFSDLKDQQKEATAALKEAKAAWESAYKELGKAAEDGSAQARAALKEYEAALDQAIAHEKAAQDALVSAQREAYQKRIQQSRDYQEYLEREKLATVAAGAAIGHTVPQMAAASGAIRELSGNFDHNVRAAERLLVSTLGLGPALQMLFPVVGALAFAGIIFDIGEKLYKAFDMGGERARKVAEEIEHDTESMKLMNDELNVEIDRIGVANAKLEHRPANYMKLAIDEAALAADRLNEKLDGSLRRIESTIKGMAGSIPQQMLGLAGGTGYEQTMVSEHGRHLAEAKTEQDQLNESVSYGNSLLTRKAELEKWIADPGTSPATVNNYRTELAAIQHLVAMQEQEKAAIRAAMDVEVAEGQHATDERAHQEETAAKKAMTERGKAVMEMMKIDENAAKEQKRITEEVQADGVRALKEDETEQKRAAEAEIRAQRDAATAYKQKLQVMEDVARARMEDAADSINRQMGAVRADGNMSPANEAATLSALAAQKLQIENAYYQQMEALYVKDSLQWQRLEDQRLTAVRKSADEQAKIQDDLQKKQLRSYQQITDTVNREFLSTFDNILSGQVSIGRGAEQMASRMLLSFTNAMVQEALKHAQTKEIELLQEAAHWVKVNVFRVQDAAAQTATDASANATKVTEAIATNLAVAMSNAAVAATGAYAATAMIPIVGPALAPGVAAGTYGGAMAFASLASAAGGWDNVPSDQIAQIHKREMILPASIAQPLRGAIANGGLGGGPSIHYAPTIHGAGNDKEMRKVIRASSRDVVAAMKRGIRNGHF